MAGKLTIRRVGNFLPLVCLVALLVVAGLIIWLSTVGIPGCAVRHIEAEAAKAGIPVSIDKIQLVPRAGLAVKAEGISLKMPQPGAPDATLKLRKAQLAFSLARLLDGDTTPQNLRIKGGSINLPTGESKTELLKLDHVDINVAFPPQANGISARINTFLNGIELDTQIVLSRKTKEQQNAESVQDAGKPLLDLEETGKMLAAHRSILQKVQKTLAAQSWDKKQHPLLKLKVYGGATWKSELTAWIPSFDFDYIHVRDTSVEAHFENNTFTINKLNLQTVNPDSKVSLQAAYDLTTRELEFNTKSSAPIVNILDDYIDDEQAPLLKKIKSGPGNPPIIELSGSAGFTEDYALNRITLRGKLDHENIQLGSTRIEHLLLSFFVRDGNFNIDNFLLSLPEGHLKASAQAENGTGTAKIDINLSDETLVTLARDFCQMPDLKLPAELAFGQNIKLRANCTVASAIFEPGKTRIEDLLPTLKSCQVQFNAEHISWEQAQAQITSLTLTLDDIDLSGKDVAIGMIELKGYTREATAIDPAAAASNLVYDIHLESLRTGDNFHALSIGKAAIRASLESAHTQTAAIEALHASAELSDFHTNWHNGLNALRSDKIFAKVRAQKASYDKTQAQGLSADITIPEGLRYTDGWKNMQRDAEVSITVDELHHNGNFNLTGGKLHLLNTDADECRMNFNGNIGKEKLDFSCTASLEHDRFLLINNLDAAIPAASLAPLVGGEPLEELKLPRLITIEGDILFDTKTSRLVKTHYDVYIPELVRVCKNVHVHKGMEIPLSLKVNGEFSTAEDGNMHYAASIAAIHRWGALEIDVEGNPLKECHITGSNTIPVNVINALIDNADAHWIMRDFRCTDGVTQNIITDIDTTIRYDKGIYVHALCKAHLKYMEFMLGALRDKYDANGKETGEEYLRTDLGKNPYTLVKEGKCDVEVIVQLDCVDEKGTPLPERIRINLTNPDLLYDNRPWLKRNGFKTGALTSRITGEAVRFNIEDCTISLHKLKGNCYPSYSIGMYYAPIQHYMEDIILKDPVDIETDYCIFPISRHCDVPMKGLIKAYGATGAGFRFLGTTIPFTNFSGFINISDTDVYLDRMNAETWGGAMNGSLRIGFSGEHTTLDGYITARGLNLKDIVASYGSEFTPATCSGFIRFQASRPELNDVVAYGQVSLKDGNLMQLGLFRPIGSLLSDMPGHLSKLQQSVITKAEEAPPTWADKLIRFVFDSGSETLNTVQESSYSIPFANHFLRYGIDEASARFDIKNGHLITRDMKAKGYNLNVNTQLDINLDTLTVKGDLWPKISSVPTAIISPITILSKFLIDIDIYGDLLHPQWKFGLSKKLKGETPSITGEQAEPETK